MIEKLKQTVRGFDEKPQMPNAYEYLDKINELVDAVNELQLTVSKMENLEHLKKIGQGFKKLTDPYAEQRKWIGKLCWFWNIYRKHAIAGILENITDRGIFINKDNNLRYACCEPVSPDDDIIYKKEQQ